MRTGNKRKNLKKAVLPICIIAGVFLAVLLIVPRLENLLYPPKENISTRKGGAATRENSDVYISGNWYRRKTGYSNILVIGVDNREGLLNSNAYNNEGQADFLMLVSYDPESGESFAVHINRDTMTNIPVLSVNGKQLGRTNAQIALAYNYGNGRETSCENVVDAVRYLLYDIPIDNYIALSMDAVATLNDGVGGVEVEILDDFSGVDASLVMGEKVLLQGEQALNYVRARGGMQDSSNLKRMERQRRYVSAWIDQARKLSEKQLSELALSVTGDAVSDFRQDQFLNFVDKFLTFDKDVELYQLPGEAETGEEFMEYHLDEPGVQSMVLDLFYDDVTNEY